MKMYTKEELEAMSKEQLVEMLMKHCSESDCCKGECKGGECSGDKA